MRVRHSNGERDSALIVRLSMQASCLTGARANSVPLRHGQCGDRPLFCLFAAALHCMMKCVGCHGSISGGLMPAALPAAMHLISQAMLSPKVRMICRPSRSWACSSGLRPWVAFQYWDDTTGILLMVKYLFSRSKAALAPPRRQFTTQAAGLKA